MGIDTVRHFRERIAEIAAACPGVPIVAIGGIDAATGRPLVDAGCHALAVITAILAAPDVRSAAADLAALFREAR